MGVLKEVEELLEINPWDKHHLFGETKRFFYAVREIQLVEINDESLDEFMTDDDELSKYQLQERTETLVEGEKRA